MKRRAARAPLLIAAAVCFSAAAALRFALIGYETLALLLACLGAALALGALLPRRGRIVLLVVCCLGAGTLFAATIPVLRAAGGGPETDAAYLIVLGAGVNGAAPSRSLADRLTAALDYLTAHPACRAIVSGGMGPGEQATEAQVMFDWLTARGISPERILREERAASTLENLRFSFALIPEEARASVAVVSSEYHLYRAKLLARELGYDVAALPARTSLPVLRLNYFLREGLGLIYYAIFGIA